MAKASQPRVKLTRQFFDQAREALAPRLEKTGDKVASRAESLSGLPTGVEFERDYNGDWRALVTITHVSGKLAQIEKGALTKAAAAEGLRVDRYKFRG